MPAYPWLRSARAHFSPNKLARGDLTTEPRRANGGTMGTELTEIEEYCPAMSALTALQREFVYQWCEHPNYNGAQLVAAAGFQGNANTLRVTAHRLTHDEKILAAMNEEAGKRIKTGGLIGVQAIIKIALNEQHKDHLKAALALLDRTGFHALTEHKVTVDDKRPQTKAELVEAVRRVAAEAGLTADAAEKLIGQGATDVVDATFEEIPNEEDL